MAAAAHAATTATMLWDVATRSTLQRTLLPGLAQQAPAAFNGQLAAADAEGNLLVVATEADDREACFVTLKYTAASGVVAWRQSVCGLRNTYGAAVAVDAAGDVLVTGAVNGELRMRKLSGASGSVLWDRTGDGEFGFGMALTASGDAVALATVRNLKTDLRVVRRRGSDGALVWQRTLDSGYDDAAAGIAVDGEGNVAVAGTYRNARGDEDWFAARLAPTGEPRWQRAYDSGALDIAAHVAMDGGGNVIVAGTSSVAASTNVMRTVKLGAADGATLWDRSHGSFGLSGASAVRVDAQGDIFVAGHAAVGAGDDDMRTLKYRGGDGHLLWQASASGSRPGMDLGHALAVDAQGNAVVTGATYAAGSANPEFTTVKYAAGDGRVLWASALRGSGDGWQDSGHAVVSVPGATYAVGVTTDAGQLSGLRVARFSDGATPLASPAAHNVQGLWWRAPAGSESGWGLNLTQQGDVLFATWFTYDADGQPMWLVMPRLERAGPDSYFGSVYRTQGPAFNAMPFDAAKVAATAVGTASFSFTDPDNGVFLHTVEGATGTHPITRQVYAYPVPKCAQGGTGGAQPNYQDLWWSDPAGSESGWGLNVTHQGDILFVTWFTYGPAGRGMWLVGSRIAKTGNATFAGSLYRTSGPPFDASPWNPARVGVAEAGRMTLAFDDDTHGTFSYTLDGVTQTKRITRQVYAAPATRCG